MKKYINTVATWYPDNYPNSVEWGSVVYENNAKTSTMHLSGSFDYNGKKIYIREVIYSEPATIVIWNDGVKTVCKCSEEDFYSKEAGLAMCILKRLVGPTKVHNIFSDWVDEELDRVSIKDVRRKNK